MSTNSWGFYLLKCWLVICFTLSTLSSELDDHSYDIFFLLFSVELGRRYFPNCSQVLDKFLEDDLPDSPDALDLQNGTSDEQNVKRMRFCELKEDVRKAFSKDRADNSMFSILSSSSSSSPPPKVAKKWQKFCNKFPLVMLLGQEISINRPV